ncbi:MAG: hypothetical protein JST39_20640, partial [Bacteroidetes bacterium]|nr:hypothetical protein [Bacteroidota bacterium]
MNNPLNLLLLALAPVIAFQSARAQSADSTKDKEAIRQLVLNYENAWNRHDPAGLAANYTIDATWV